MSFIQHPLIYSDGEEHQRMKQIAQNVPHWLIETNQKDDIHGPLQLHVRHGHSEANAVDEEYARRFRELKIENGEELETRPELRFRLILEYFLEKIKLQNDQNIGITTKGEQEAKMVNISLLRAINQTPRKIHTILISPRRRAIQTAKIVMNGIVDIGEIGEGTKIEKDGIIIGIDQRLREKEFGGLIGFRPFWVGKFLQENNHAQLFKEWIDDSWNELCRDFPMLSDNKETILHIVDDDFKDEPNTSVVERTRDHASSVLSEAPEESISLSFHHAGTTMRLVASILDLESIYDESSPHRMYRFVRPPNNPKNCSTTVVGYDPIRGMYLVAYNLLSDNIQL